MTSEKTASPPPRRKRFWFVLLGVAMVILSLVGIALLGHAIWRGKERARADALVATIRARREPIVVTDLVDPPVPDDRNIVVLLKQAQAAYVKDDSLADREQRLAFDDPHAFEPPLTDAEVTFLRDESTHHAAVLRILAGLSERDAVAWDNPPTTPAINWLLPELSQGRTLANLLGDQARLQTHEGRWLEAFETLRDLPPIAEAISRRTSMIGYLVAAGIEALAAERYLELAPTLDVNDPAVRSAAARAIAELMDDGKLIAFNRRGLLGERVILHDTFRAIAEGKLSAGQLMGAARAGPANMTEVMTPLIYRGDATSLEYLTVALSGIDAKSKADYAPTAARLTAIRSTVNSSNLEIFTSIMLPSLENALTVRFRVLTDRHIAATLLAIRLYQQDHGGERPPTLDALVPGYLPAAPMDCISGKPLGYDPKRRIVWGVGQDEVDGNGDVTPLHPGQPTGRYNMRDLVVFLDRQPRPATAPSSD